MKPLAVVTGASSGIGRATAQRLSRDFRVVGTTRDASAVRDRLEGVRYLSLDLADPASIARCSADILALGAPAVVVNNAGESQSGPFEELPREAIERLFQVNVIGQVDFTRRLTPAMRAAGRGRVVMVGSMLASFPLAYRSSYVASKAAIKGFALAARRELSPFGVWVCVVEPGAIATGISARRTKYVDDAGPFADEFRVMQDRLDGNEAAGIPAERVAEVICRAIRVRRPRPVYAQGSSARVAYPLSRLVPQQWMLRMISRRHGL
ncbi:short-chain dehydrogenase/reductase [Corynebacterium liangguodongii]|uniref:Short-chain dehydrogenase/reductase n=1 Tax=Corynebacterium liangguodongii TaxID=2079535 RepID=A0A2S0WHA3_9CORY|nr:short-chain dehydrogenase/reductase [Corynebacterium liangguodongii]PWB99254.1 SDR family NAD(P)-dependent oxidoreductase [Corynebacterium liangguodongii]